MFLATELSFARSAPRMPRTSTPAALYGEDASACPSTIGAATRTPSTLATRSATRPVGEGRPLGLNEQVAFSPSILSNNSWRKPFMTAMTMMRVATPSMMPKKEKPAITEMNPSRRRARR